ncbi:cAMP-specific 3',5'-cyclic phosphodiesterase, isoform (Partial), partial [Seminavis robusta]
SALPGLQNKMNDITRRLESKLGPDTSNLKMRFGLHSGPVTAGVLRGDRARFQLFGDTVNTASLWNPRSEEQIQVSEPLPTSPKGHEDWLIPREDEVNAKGKGVIKTYWLVLYSKQGSSQGDASECRSSRSVSGSDDSPSPDLSDPERTIDQSLVNARGTSKTKQRKVAPSYFPPQGQTCIAFSSFHPPQHACHVCMSVKKLLNRIVSVLSDDDADNSTSNPTAKKVAMQQLYDLTHGLSTDPMAAFAMTFSGLIHDVDHRGVSNTQLSVEEPRLASKYSNQSIAEQNSLDMAWDVLMEDCYSNLRLCLFTSQDELVRFRQLIVNVVLATDIFDKELNDLRKRRWAQAFSGEAVVGKNSDHERVGAAEDSDRRATIVIEHIIQASDVSHTMQHWHVYQKWNKCLFLEMTAAFHAGRFAKNPADFWYKGEIGFFDNYIIPLAKKLEDCGVFGVSSDEYLNYALKNREEWAERGRDIVASWVAEENSSSLQHVPSSMLVDSREVQPKSFIGDESGLETGISSCDEEESSGSPKTIQKEPVYIDC